MRKFTATQYLMIDIANHYGLDKKSWDERLEWFKQNENQLENLTAKADEPAEYTAAVDAYRHAQRGEVVYHAVGLDATASGYQQLSVLTGDRNTAYMCNVLDSGIRGDLYTTIYKKFSKVVNSDPFITRDKVKKAIMTTAYGSTAQPRDIFGDLVDTFYDVMAKECPLVWQLNQTLQENWISDRDTIRWVMPDNFHVNCTLHAKEEVEFKFRGQVRTFIHDTIKPCAKGRSLSANLAHSCDSLAAREIVALAMHDPIQILNIESFLNQKGKSQLRKGNDKRRNMVLTLVQLYEQSGFLSARILDYVDRDNIKLIPEAELKELLFLVPNRPFNVYCVHDCFHVHPNYGNDIRWLYITHLARVARSNLLEFILRQMYNCPEITVQKADLDMWKDVLKSEYALS